MTIAGSTTRTLSTPEELHGLLRRTKPANTTIDTSDSPARNGAPQITSLSADAPLHRTQLLPGDLNSTNGVHASHATQHEQLVKQTQKWVAQAFYGTMLKQMRESPFHSDMFEGGKGGQAFGAMYDQELAQRMARGAGSKLVNTIVNHIEHLQQRSDQVQQNVQQQMQLKMQQQMRTAKATVDPKLVEATPEVR